jgi:hypothetical protein
MTDDFYVAKSEYTFTLPEMSEWKCYMFGNSPEVNEGIMYVPRKGHEPNWFVRWMMKVCFDCTWVKEQK